MRPQKSLGQHFLTSEAALAALVGAAHVTAGDVILEIGPGKGALTDVLLKRGARVIAIEKDTELACDLRKRFEGELTADSLVLIEGDALAIPSVSLGLKDGGFKFVANIPYNITGHILRRIIGGKTQPSRVALVVQKEVGERIVARDGKESMLSISIKAYGVPRYVQMVKRGSFFPIPSVDSAIVAVDNISRDFFDTIDEQNFFELVRRGFAHKRKTLKRNLGLPGEVFSACALNPATRAETLSLSDWRCLAEKTAAEH